MTRCDVAQAKPVREALELAKNIIFGMQHQADRERDYAKSADYQSYIESLDAALAATPPNHMRDDAQAERVWHRKDCPFCGSPDGQYSASLQDLPAAFFCKGCGINAAQPPAAPVETCKTCNGRREVGGFDRGDNAYRSEPCPECSPQRSSAGSSRVNFGPLDNFGPEDNDPGTAFIIHNVDDTVTIKVRSPGDRVFSEVEMSLDAWLKLRSVGGPVTSNEPQAAGLPVETAPRDGRSILIYKLGAWSIASWNGRGHWNLEIDAAALAYDVGGEIQTIEDRWVQAWMPLPSSPLSRPHGGGAA